MVKYGIDVVGDGLFGFMSFVIVNMIYGWWWYFEDECLGFNEWVDSLLLWMGDYLDGLGNYICMMVYVNFEDCIDELKCGDGYGIVKFDKCLWMIMFECWLWFVDVVEGDDV